MTGFGWAFRSLAGRFLRHEPGRTALTIAGVALGVAVLTAIALSNDSAVESFKRSVDQVTGPAALVVQGNGFGLDGELAGRLERAEGVAAALPMIESFASLGASGETVLLLGVDLIRAPAVLEERGAMEIRFWEGLDPESLFTRGDLVLMPEQLASRVGVVPGNLLDLEFSGEKRQVLVGGIASGEYLVDAYGGNVLVADIGTVDALAGRGGLVDRISIVLKPGAVADDVAQALRAVAPAGVIVERAEMQGKRADEMLAAFRFNLNALGYLAVLVGAFLIYNTVSISVVRRRPIIGTVRALGVPASQVRLVFLAEGLLFGAAGSALGLVLGIVVGRVLLGTVSEAISFNFFDTGQAGFHLGAGTIVWGFAVGVIFSVMASLQPAQEAATTPPANVSRRGSEYARRGGHWPRVLAGAACFAAAAVIAALEKRPGLPVQGYSSALLLLVGAVAIAKPALEAVAAMLKIPYTRLAGAEGLLAVQGIQAALRRSAVAASGLMIAVAMTLAVRVMVESFRNTVSTWMNQVLVADLFVAPVPPAPGVRQEGIDAKIAERVRGLTGVRHVESFRARRVIFNGRETWLGAGDLRAERYADPSLSGNQWLEAHAKTQSGGGVFVTEAFARKNRLRHGDKIALDSPAGVISAEVVGIYTDYSSEQGIVMMDSGAYSKMFADGRIDTLSIHLSPGATGEAVRERLAELFATTPGLPPMSIRMNEDIRTFALQAFDRTFAVTRVMELVALAVALLGVATTLLSQVLDRREELLTLRYLGASAARVARIIVLEASVIAIAGTAIGAVAGIALAWLLAKVIMLQSFGWTISFEVRPATVLVTVVIVLAGTIIAALLPAREAGKFHSISRGKQ